MNLSSRSRLFALIGVMSCLAVMIVWAATTSWVKLRDMRNYFARVQAP
jgi:hypothetical protein